MRVSRIELNEAVKVSTGLRDLRDDCGSQGAQRAKGGFLCLRNAPQQNNQQPELDKNSTTVG